MLFFCAFSGRCSDPGTGLYAGRFSFQFPVSHPQGRLPTFMVSLEKPVFPLATLRFIRLDLLRNACRKTPLLVSILTLIGVDFDPWTR